MNVPAICVLNGKFSGSHTLAAEGKPFCLVTGSLAVSAFGLLSQPEIQGETGRAFAFQDAASVGLLLTWVGSSVSPRMVRWITAVASFTRPARVRLSASFIPSCIRFFITKIPFLFR
jgi:hypothetical protein